jgi:hypothetical protein
VVGAAEAGGVNGDEIDFWEAGAGGRGARRRERRGRRGHWCGLLPRTRPVLDAGGMMREGGEICKANADRHLQRGQVNSAGPRRAEI